MTNENDEDGRETSRKKDGNSKDGKKDGKKDGGKGTLCDFKRGKMLGERYALYHRVVAQPAFFCKKCARVAAAARWLCKPCALEVPPQQP